MHPHIERILLRANNLLVAAHHDPKAGAAHQRALQAAFAKLNPGETLQNASGELIKLAPDPDGSETVSAARFVAQAMGLKIAQHGCLDGEADIGPNHLVIWRRVEGQIQPQDDRRQARAKNAGLCIEIYTAYPQVGDTFGQNLCRRRNGEDDVDPPVQPSFF